MGASALRARCFRRPKIQAELVCPACRSTKFRRSHRRTVVDYLLAVGGILPWRCASCETRFRARRIPFRRLLFAHCRICGNLNLQRIASGHVPGQASFIARILGVPAFRCVPCRNKFFSVRPLWQERHKEAVAQNH
jgi:hypothetical protein